MNAVSMTSGRYIERSKIAWIKMAECDGRDDEDEESGTAQALAG